MQEVKIEKITAKNCKAIKEFTAYFGGESAHITAQNGQGKSTFIKVLTDRLIGLKPSIITNIDAEEGYYTMELTDGARFVWEFNHSGKEKISYYSADGIIQNREALKAVISRYFKNSFDINKFLVTTQSMIRLKMISALINVDLSELQREYRKVFDLRAVQKKALKVLEVQKIKTPSLVPEPNQTEILSSINKSIDDTKNLIESKKEEIKNEKTNLNQKYLENKRKNDLEQENYDLSFDNLVEKTIEENKAEKNKNDKIKEITNLNKQVSDLLAFSELEKYYHFVSAHEYINSLEKGTEKDLPKRESLDLPNPIPSNDFLTVLESELSELENKLNVLNEEKQTKIEEVYRLNQKYNDYLSEVLAYEQHFIKIQQQQEIVREHENLVENALNEIKKVVQNAKLPKEFEIDLLNKNDILFNGFPITNETLASSAIFIAAFKLAVYNLDLFKVVHFDVSYLDYLNRLEVVNEAEKLGIQLFTESPATNKNELELQVKIHSLD